MRIGLLLAGCVSLAGCETIENRPTNVFGIWGGPHIGAVFRGGIGELQFDCAGGTIDDPIPARDGPFTAVGSYRAGQPGPVRVGQIYRNQRATYSGQMDKKVMTLNILLEDNNTLGPFTLTEGQAPEITRCL